MYGSTVCVITVDGYFLLDPCATARCEYGRTCRALADRSVSCVCSSCPQASEGDVVCGDDGVTYDDICAMRASSCTERKTVKVAYAGQCGKLQVRFIILDYQQRNLSYVWELSYRSSSKWVRESMNHHYAHTVLFIELILLIRRPK